ncbi:hypothetical protein [Demequina aurantiaca]|uniref:hypothetical protein n=1 Tax=Demequina aurantiaca TaxID=676200 RepID=UPI003D32B03B
MAAFIRQSLTVGALIATTALVLSGCSADSDSPSSPSATVGQSIEPTAAPSEQAGGQEWVATDNYLAVPVGITFPSQTDPNYVFSDEPQGAAEQWIFDNAPEQWALGVRAVSIQGTTKGYNYEDSLIPSVLVQYINGERYEGTESMPLGFRGQIEDPGTIPADAVDRRLAGLKDSSMTEADPGNNGRGGYIVDIVEQIGARGGSGGAKLYISDFRSGRDTPAAGEEPRNFPTWEAAWAYLQENGFTPNSEGARTLNPGEIAQIMATDAGEKAGDPYVAYVYDPRVGDFVVGASN